MLSRVKMRARISAGLKRMAFFSLAFTALFLFVTSFPASAQTTSGPSTIGGVNLGNLPNYLFFFANGSVDANWQGATKGFIGDVAVDGIQAKERTSGSVPYAGTIYTNDATLGQWQNILSQQQNVGQAQGMVNQTSRIAGLHSDLAGALKQISALPVTPGFESVSSSSLNGLNTQDGKNEVYVINITSGLNFSNKIYITGDPGDVYILRWGFDPTSGKYQGQVKPQSGGAIVPLGGLKPSNFINAAGDINASGGGGNPASPYPQGPLTQDGQGSLIKGGSNFNGGGFFTGYWLTTGSPTTLDPSTGLYYGPTSPLSNAIFVGGWYTLSNQFSLTSGTSGVYVSPNPATATMGTTLSATVTGQADATDQQTFDWTIAKSVDTTSAVVPRNTSYNLRYTIQATRKLVAENVQTDVHGTVTVTNTGSTPTENLQIVAYLDGVTGASTTIVPSTQLLPGQTQSYPVDFVLTNSTASSYNLDAQVTITNYAGSPGTPAGPTPEPSMTIPVHTTVQTTDGSATISDAISSLTGFTYTIDQPGPWTLNDSGTITYTLTITNTCAPYQTTYCLGNTATLVKNTTNQQSSASANVEISTGSACSN